MGYFQRERERIKISKEEYEKNAYKNSGLLAMLDPNEIIGYKYYKLGKEKLVYICGSKEYDYLKNNNII